MYISFMFKIAFIGGGINSAIGEVHRAASQMDGFFKLVAGAFSTHDAVNRATAETWGVSLERTYADYKDLLAKEKGKLDAVVILRRIFIKTLLSMLCAQVFTLSVKNPWRRAFKRAKKLQR